MSHHFVLDGCLKICMMPAMRFRTFGSMPSFMGYLSGHSLMRTIAYGAAAGWQNALEAGDRAAERMAHWNLKQGVKRYMQEQGWIPRPGEKYARNPPPPWPEGEAWKNFCKETGYRWRPMAEAVAESESRQRATRGAAVSSNGGLRGSRATRR